MLSAPTAQREAEVDPVPTNAKAAGGDVAGRTEVVSQAGVGRPILRGT
jgi:hypothetical protein